MGKRVSDEEIAGWIDSGKPRMATVAYAIDLAVARQSAREERRLREQAERERDELREIINASDWHGCVSGDCPHDREALCVERLGIDIAKAEAATTLAYADALHMVSRQMDSIIGAENWQNRILQLPAQLRRLRDVARRQGGGEGGD